MLSWISIGSIPSVIFPSTTDDIAASVDDDVAVPIGNISILFINLPSSRGTISTKKSNMAVFEMAPDISFFCNVFLRDSSVCAHALTVNSIINISHAFANSAGTSADIIVFDLTSSSDFIILLILAKGNSNDLNDFVSNKLPHFSCNSRCLSIERLGNDVKSVVLVAVAVAGGGGGGGAVTVGVDAIATVAGKDMVGMVNDAVAGVAAAVAVLVAAADA